MRPQTSRSTSNSLCRDVQQIDSTTQGQDHVDRFDQDAQHSQRKLIERITCSRGVSTEIKHPNHEDKLVNWSAKSQQTPEIKNKKCYNVAIDTVSVKSAIGDVMSDSSDSMDTSGRNKGDGGKLVSNRASVPLFISSDAKISEREKRSPVNEKGVQLNLRQAKCSEEKAFRVTQSLSNNLMKMTRSKPLKVKYVKSRSRSGLLKQAEARIDTNLTKLLSVSQKSKEEKRTDIKRRVIKTTRARLRKCGVTVSQVMVTQRHRSSGTDDKLPGSIGDITTWATAVITDILYKPEPRKSITKIEKHTNQSISHKPGSKVVQKNVDRKRTRVSKKVSSGMIVKQRILSQCKNQKLLDSIKQQKSNLKPEKSMEQQQAISNLTVGSCKNSTVNLKDLELENNNTKLLEKSKVTDNNKHISKDCCIKLVSSKKGRKMSVHILTSSTRCNASCTSIGPRRKETVFRPVVKKCFSAIKSGNIDMIRKHKDSFPKHNVKSIRSQNDIDNKGDVVMNTKIKPDTERNKKEDEKEKVKRKSKARITSAENKTYTIEPKKPDERTQRRAQKHVAEIRAAAKLKSVNPYLSIKKIQHDVNRRPQLDEIRTTGKVTNPFKKIVDPDDPPPKCTLQIGSSFSFEMELFKPKQNITSSSSSSSDRLSDNVTVGHSKSLRNRRQKRSPSVAKFVSENTKASVRDQIHCTLDLSIENNNWNPYKFYKLEPLQNNEAWEKKPKKRHRRSRIEDDFIAKEVISSVSCPENENDKTDNHHMRQKGSNSKIPAKANNIVAKLKRCFCAFKFPNKIKENGIRQPYISPSGKELQVGSNFSFNLEFCKDPSSPDAVHTPIISGHTIKSPSEVEIDVIYGNDNCNENAKLPYYSVPPPTTEDNMRRCYRWLNLHSRNFAQPSKATLCPKEHSNTRKRTRLTDGDTLSPLEFEKEKFMKDTTMARKLQKLPCEANSTNSQVARNTKLKPKVPRSTCNEIEPNDGDHLSQTKLSAEILRTTSRKSKMKRNDQIVTPNDVMQAHPSMFLRGSKLSFDVEICKGGTPQIRYSKPKTLKKQSKSKVCNNDCAKECQKNCDLDFDQFDTSSRSTSVLEKNSWDPVRYRNFLKQILGPNNKDHQQLKPKKLKPMDEKEKKANKTLKRNVSDHAHTGRHRKSRKHLHKKYKCACLVTPEESTQLKHQSRHSLLSDLNALLSPDRRYEGYPKPEYLTHKFPKKSSNTNAPTDISVKKRLDFHEKESEINLNVHRSVSSILKKCLSTLKFQKAKKDEMLVQARSEETSFESAKRMQALRISGVNVVPGKCTYLEYPVLLDKNYTDISKSISDEHRKFKKVNISSSKWTQPKQVTLKEDDLCLPIPCSVRSNYSINVANCLASRRPQRLAPIVSKFYMKPQEQYRGIHMSENVKKSVMPVANRNTPREVVRQKHDELTTDAMKRKFKDLKQDKTLGRISESKDMLARYDTDLNHSECLLKKQLRPKQKISRNNFNFQYFFELSPTYNIPRCQDKAVARSSRGKRSSTLVNPTLASHSSIQNTKTNHYYGPDGRLLQRRSSIIVAAMWKVIKDDELRTQRTRLHKKGTPCKCKKGAPCQIVNKTTCRDKDSKQDSKLDKGKGNDHKGKSGKKCACGGKKSSKGGQKAGKVEKSAKGGICGKFAKSDKGGKGKCQGKGICPSSMDKQEDDEQISRDDYPEISDCAFKVLHSLKLLPDKKKYVKPKAYKVKCPGKKKCSKKKGDGDDDDDEEEEEEEEDEEKLRKKILETLYITKDKMKFKFDSDICHKVQGKKKPPFFNPPGKLQKSVCEWPGCKDEVEKLKRPCTVCGFNDDAALHIKVDRHGMGVVNKDELRKKIREREVVSGKKKVKCSEFLKDTGPGDRPSCLCCPTPVCTKHDADRSKKPPCGMQLTLDPKYSLKMPCSPFRPCICGSGVCKKEHLAMMHTMGRPKNVPCVCGSPVCDDERKHVADRRHAKEAMKLKRKLAKMKAEHRDFSLKNFDLFYLNSYLQGDLELKLFQDTMRGLPLSDQERDTLVQRDKERELRKDRNCRYRMMRYAEIEEEIARLRRKDDKKATFIMGDPYKLSTLSAITGSATDLVRASGRGISNILRKGFRRLVDPSCPEGKLPCKRRFINKIKKDYCYGHIKTPLERAQARIASFGCVRYILECIYEHPTLYECLTSCTEKGQELRRKRARLRQEIRDAKCTVATDAMLNPPCPSCYKRFPGIYPRLLSIVSIYKQCKDMLCFLLAVLVWTPCLLCAEAVRAAICCSLCI